MIDASLDTRVAAELNKRGRSAKSAAELNVHRIKDPQMLEALAAKLGEPWVLVTADDLLPFEHGDDVRRLGITIATLDGEWEEVCARAGVHLSQEQYKHETVHRWAHAMAAQSDRSVRRYSILSHRQWKPKRRYS